MDSNYNVGFYNQYDILVVELDHAMEIQISGTYLICSDANNSVKFFANTISLISGPTFSQSYTPLNVGFYQQDSAYFTRLNEINDYILNNVVKVLYRDINALIFADGTVQTTAATGGGGSGTVTSVGFTEGTGIDITGTNPITTSGTVTITNTAPDQVVTLTDGTGISTSGTYPNFTITNTAPDQTVTLTEGTGIDVTGTYPNFTIASTITGGIPKGTAAGTDTYTTTISGVASYADGDCYLIRFTNGNTTGCTLDINSLGAKDLYRNNDGLLIGGDIESGAEMICVYNSTLNGFQVIGTSPNTLISYVTNADSVTITKGQPVYAFGGQGDRLTVKRAYNTGDSTSAQTIGLVLSSSIGVNQKGLIMMQGLLDGLSILPTSTWADGDPVYLGTTAGSITKTKQYAPNHLVYLGFVTTASNGSAGRLYVRVQNGYEMDELHNVQAQSPSLKDTLYYDNTVSPAQWKTASIATILGYTPGQGTVTSIATTSPILGGTITTSGTISIQQADTSKDGYISSTDWNTFNNKQNQLNGTGFVKASGTTISYDNSTYYLASNPSGYTSNTGTVTSVSALTLGTTGTDLSSSVATGTTTPVITLNVPTASASNRGALSSTDWSTFNGKQNAITLTTTGTSGAATLVGSTLNIPQYSPSGQSVNILHNILAQALTGAASPTTRYHAISGTISTLTTAYQIPLPTACTFGNFYFRIYSAQPASGSLVLTLQKNAADTASTITIAAGSAIGNYTDNTNTVSFSAGDTWQIKIVQNATSGSTNLGGYSFKLTGI
jgi:hypothetical protein